MPEKTGGCFETSASLPHCPSSLTSRPCSGRNNVSLRRERVSLYYSYVHTYASSIREKLETAFELGRGREEREGEAV